MNKEALEAIMATTLLVLSLFSPTAGAVSISYEADSEVDQSVSTSASNKGQRICEGQPYNVSYIPFSGVPQLSLQATNGQAFPPKNYGILISCNN